MTSAETNGKVGLFWFFRDPRVKKSRKIIFVAVFGIMISANIWTLFVTPRNQYVSIQFWNDFGGITMIAAIVVGLLCGYLITWLSYPGKQVYVLASVYGLLTWVLGLMVLSYGLPSMIDLMTNSGRQYKEHQFAIVEPNYTYKGCKSGMKINAPSPFRQRICSIPVYIQTRAKTGDTIVLMGEESYWVFRYDRVRLLPQ